MYTSITYIYIYIYTHSVMLAIENPSVAVAVGFLMTVPLSHSCSASGVIWVLPRSCELLPAQHTSDVKMDTMWGPKIAKRVYNYNN